MQATSSSVEVKDVGEADDTGEAAHAGKGGGADHGGRAERVNAWVGERDEGAWRVEDGGG